MTTNYIRRMFKDGVSISDTLNGNINNSATSFTLASGTSFPDGSVGPFIVLIESEKILCASRSGAVFTVASSGRGYNGTSAVSHNTGVGVYHTIDAQDLDEANQTMAQTIGAIAAKGDLLVGSAANTLSKLSIGSTAQTPQVVSGTLAYVGFGSGRSQPVGSADADGTDTTYTRSDHVHQGVTSYNTRHGAVTMTAADVEALFTADQQIFSGTGSGTGEIIDLATALEEYFTTAGQLIVGTGSGTGKILAEGAAGTTLFRGGADASALEWINVPGQILASTNIHNPNYSTNSATFVVVNATNAKLTFTAPASGNVMLIESGNFNNGTAGAQMLLTWSSANTNNANLIGDTAKSGFLDQSQYLNIEHYVSGLTGGTSYTVYLQFAYTSTSGTVGMGSTTSINLKCVAL